MPYSFPSRWSPQERAPKARGCSLSTPSPPPWLPSLRGSSASTVLVFRITCKERRSEPVLLGLVTVALRDIIFNAQYPELPPDFIFGEDAEFLPDPSALHNLASWNPSNPECLLLVVKELVQQYHQFQCSRLRESSRLMFEYQTLLEEPQYGGNMEIYAGKKNNWTGEFSARFLLKLPVDFSNIPTYLLKDVNEDPGEDVALLSVSFEDTEATQVYPKLYLSPRIEQDKPSSNQLEQCGQSCTGGGHAKPLEPSRKSRALGLRKAQGLTEVHLAAPRLFTSRLFQEEAVSLIMFPKCATCSPTSALGGSSALHIPAFPGGGCLIDYVPQVCHLLTNKKISTI
ncbi:BRE [Cervus elaphus hippelaphus]|uniref:BRISC and BRCA1-A complex member 2 n=1 Tax=Cervus elaphus hippelaphus TaxID=46360 RepID=A0A212CX87_CEREH|nr:BRE [Cervus elaphus hippelaphus]